jgi:hypothetical protein
MHPFTSMYHPTPCVKVSASTPMHAARNLASLDQVQVNLILHFEAVKCNET